MNEIEQCDALLDLFSRMQNLTENTFLVSFEIPAQTRSIYIDYGPFNIGGLIKYKLNLPKFFVKQARFNSSHPVKWTIQAVNDDGEMCYVPFTNMLDKNVICFGEVDPVSERGFKEAFFNTKFSMSGPYHIFRYFPGNEEVIVQDVQKFYSNWEKTGKLELVKING